MSHKMSRRQFNQYASTLALGLPVLTSLPFNVYAQAVTAPKRLIMIRSKNGFLQANWAMNSGKAWDWQKVRENNPIFGAKAVQFATDVNYVKLSDVAYTNTIIESSGLKNHKAKINLISGLDLMTRHAHNSFNFLCASTIDNANANEYTGPAYTYSFDMVFAKKVIDKTKYKVPVLRILPFGDQTNIVPDFLQLDSLSSHPDEGSNYGGVKRVPFLGSIQSTFQSLFAGATTPTNPTTPTPTVTIAEKIRTQLLARSQMMMQKRTLSSADKQKLQNYADTLSGLPLGNSSTTPTMIAATCNNGAGLEGGNYGINGNYQKMMDLVVQGMACQKTQMAVIGIGDHDQQMVDGGWHTITHESHFSPSIFMKYEGFVANQVSYLVDKLATTMDVDGGPMLDNTLVVWGAEHSHAYSHESLDMPIMTIGGANLNIQNGYYIDYRKRNPANTSGRGPLFFLPVVSNDIEQDRHAMGRPYNDLLVTLFHAMGVAPSVFHANNLDGKTGNLGTFGSQTVGFGEYSHPKAAAWDMSTGAYNTLFKTVYRSNLPSDDPLPFLFKG